MTTEKYRRYVRITKYLIDIAGLTKTQVMLKVVFIDNQMRMADKKKLWNLKKHPRLLYKVIESKKGRYVGLKRDRVGQARMR